MWAISVFSTILERVLLFFLCSIALGASFFFARFLRSSMLQFLLPVLTSFALFFGLYVAFPFHPFPIDGYLFLGNHPVAVALSLTLVVAIDGSRLWLRGDHGEARERGRRINAWLPSVIVAPALAVLLLNGWSLRGLARWLHADQAVQQFATGDFNGLELDAEQGLLFASGHGTNYLLAYNVEALAQPPRKSQMEVGWAQGFYLNSMHRELYVFNERSRTLLVLDTKTLALKKSVPRLDVAPGDSWIVWDGYTDSIIIVSENGVEDGSPFVVVNRATGELLYTLRRCGGRVCDPGNILLHPSKPLLYLSFWEKLLAYDIKLRKIVASIEVDRLWADRMDLTPDQRELLVADPVNSAISRFDSETLQLKGSIGTVFGVRTLAVDPVRNLLLAGSLVSNMLDVIDLETRARVAKYYVGPWLRTIALDSAAGVAYVSSIEGLFRVNYATRITN